ncbi:type II toxin-antitoxin system HicA family toxin [Candidatus Uhrbacteria bacterium]|nr:type II toxin-antitoxin system HicA family toxin [Candidatus Uhrbacteria bacterium]
MPRTPKLPAITDHDLLRALKRLGFFEHRQHGTSHLILKHPDGRRTTVAIHPGRDIPKGTLRAILRDANVTPEQLRGVP